MSIRKRHFVLLVVIAIFACSSSLGYADRAANDESAVSSKNVDDKTSLSHTKSTAEDEERGPPPLVSLSSTDSKLAPVLTKTKSISQTASKISVWRRMLGNPKSKKMQESLARAEEFVEKNPKAVETVMNNPSVREAAEKATKKRSIFYRASKTIFGVKGQKRYIVSRISCILAYVIIAVILACVFGRKK